MKKEDESPLVFMAAIWSFPKVRQWDKQTNGKQNKTVSGAGFKSDIQLVSFTLILISNESWTLIGLIWVGV